MYRLLGMGDSCLHNCGGGGGSHNQLPPYNAAQATREPSTRKGDTMTKAEKIDKARNAFITAQGHASGILNPITLSAGLEAVYPILAEINKPTEEEKIAARNRVGASGDLVLLDFVRSRNAALQKKSDPRIDIIKKYVYNWPGVVCDEVAQDCLNELDRIEKKKAI